MKLNNITDVFFDLDHTLWDFDKNSALTFDKIFKLNALDVIIDDFLEQYVPINETYWKLFREGKVEKEALRFGRLNDAFNAINYSVDEAMILKLSDDYIEHLSTFNYLFEHTFSILNYLQPNYNLHIITNGFHTVQQKKLVNSKIDHYFKTVTNSETVGVKKPDPKIFNHALQLAQCQPENSVMIGDNLEADIQGAQNIGMETVFVNMHNTLNHGNVKQIDSLIQLKKYL